MGFHSLRRQNTRDPGHEETVSCQGPVKTALGSVSKRPINPGGFPVGFHSTRSFSVPSNIKGQLGVPLIVYPCYLSCSLWILGDYNP